jgi:hypothetical protein
MMIGLGWLIDGHHPDAINRGLADAAHAPTPKSWRNSVRHDAKAPCSL